ncbi:MAG: hypothetical protein L0Y67_07815 [Gammaproteobacteria bacterium]|nr:hypothetical protein [Gammaproteobacteria bacterium]MCI0591485.1 hypothetical protein [Gammaproteobacteria bacterium]
MLRSVFRVVEDIEEVYLYTDELTYEEDVVPTIVNHKLHQRLKIKGYEGAFTVFNETYLFVFATSLLSNTKKYWVNLTYLDPNPKRYLRIAWPWLITTLTLIGIAGLLFLFRDTSIQPLGLRPTLPVMLLLGALTLISFLALVYRSEDKLVFCSQYGRTNLIELAYKNPNSMEFQNFVRELVRRIAQAKTESLQKESERLAGELREHRRLRDVRILPEKEYERSKANILSYHPKSNPTSRINIH